MSTDDRCAHRSGARVEKVWTRGQEVWTKGKFGRIAPGVRGWRHADTAARRGASDFLPYPGFAPFPYREYSEVF
ncbi:hypothetical protein ACWEP3_13660, partial [Streptomyces albidoflavus]